MNFCSTYNLQPLPIHKDTVLLFVTHLHGLKLAPSTINVYLAGVRSLQVMAGYSDPEMRSPQVKLALKAIQAVSDPPKQKSPIDYELLCKLLSMIGSKPDKELWHAVLCLAFFAGLRGSEYAAYNQGQVTKYVTLSQVTIDCSSQQTILYYKVSMSKTAVHGYTIPLGCTQIPVCPVCTMVRYLSRYKASSVTNANSPLFVTSRGDLVTKDMVNKQIKLLVSNLGLNPVNYSTHSIRSGAASTAARLGFQDWEIMRLGGWRSATYRSYIRHLDNHVAGFSARLTKNS